MKQIKSLYIHFPFCRHLCNYCDFYKHKLTDLDQVSDFEKILIKQIKAHEALLNEKGFELKNLKSLYIGGGTPSLWSTRGGDFVKKWIIKKYGVSKDLEFTLEVDPGMWTKEAMESWFNIGLNRVSVGVQSYDDHYLEVLDRVHRQKEVNETLKYLEISGVDFSVDLMLGIPKLNDVKRDIIQEINSLNSFSPSHFSIYILKSRSNYPHLNLIPNDDDIALEYLNTCEHMHKLGFEQYEVSNFALKNKQSLHNKEYWAYKSVAGVGPTATGLLIEGENSAYRYKWKPSSEGFITESLTDSSLMIEKIYMQLRAKNTFDIEILSEHNQKMFKQLVEKWDKNGLIAQRLPKLSLSSEGYLILDSLMDDIFNTLTI